MAWRAYIVDTISGQLLCPIHLPNFSWSVSVADSSLSTTKSKGVAQDEASGLKVPWHCGAGQFARRTLTAPRARPAQRRTLLDESARFGGCHRHANIVRPHRTTQGRATRHPLQPDALHGLRATGIWCARESTASPMAAPAPTSSTSTISPCAPSRRRRGGRRRCQAGRRTAHRLPRRARLAPARIRFMGYPESTKCSGVWEKISPTWKTGRPAIASELSGDTIRFDFLAGSDAILNIAQDTILELSSSPYGRHLGKHDHRPLGRRAPGLRVRALARTRRSSATCPATQARQRQS